MSMFNLLIQPSQDVLQRCEFGRYWVWLALRRQQRMPLARAQAQFTSQERPIPALQVWLIATTQKR